MTDQLVVPVILCGGAGTRLWPVSREKMPKIFVPLIGATTSFQQVLDRVTRANVFAPPIVVTNAEFRFVVAEQARSRASAMSCVPVSTFCLLKPEEARIGKRQNSTRRMALE